MEMTKATKTQPSGLNVFDRLFWDTFGNRWATDTAVTANTFLPPTDVIETDKGFEVHLSAPGFKKEDFKVELHKNTLVVSAERKFVKEENKTYHRIESHYGVFSRSFSVPESVKLEDISAGYRDGILTVYIPRDEAKPIKRQITIE